MTQAFAIQLYETANTINGCIYVLNALANESTESQHALRMLSRDLDAAYMEIVETADLLAADDKTSD